MPSWYYEDGDRLIEVSTRNVANMNLPTVNHTIDKMNQMSYTIYTLEDQADWNAVMQALLQRKKVFDGIDTEPSRRSEKSMGGRKSTSSSRARRRSKTRKSRRGVSGGR